MPLAGAKWWCICSSAGICLDCCAVLCVSTCRYVSSGLRTWSVCRCVLDMRSESAFCLKDCSRLGRCVCTPQTEGQTPFSRWISGFSGNQQWTGLGFQWFFFGSIRLQIGIAFGRFRTRTGLNGLAARNRILTESNFKFPKRIWAPRRVHNGLEKDH